MTSIASMSARYTAFFCLAFSLLLAACAGGNLPAPTGSTEVVKSPNDSREYRALVLANGMKVLLISDPSTEKAAAAVDVNAGSNSDPAAFPGLAHFLEHMLFLGTGKYPAAGEYQAYIASHGGSHNAYTAYDNTNYYFDIHKDYLEPTLDRFSQFFIAPLFTPEYVDRERNAVHSEYQSGLEDDGRRGFSALKQIYNPAHPMSRFTVGSLGTLQDHDGLSLRDALLAHYDRYYSANLMSVAILGKETLDELETLARRYFEPVENRRRATPRTDEPLFAPGSLPAMLSIEPVRDARALTYTFPIPVVRQYYRQKPLNYIANILGHEGEGSLLSVLRARGWVNGLSAGGGISNADDATFTVSMSLTEAGVERIDEISALLFQFIELTRAEGINQWMFDELGVMSELAFRFQEPGAPISYVSGMARQLQEYPPAELITAGYVYADFDPEVVRDILGYLTPGNVLLTFVGRNVEGDRVDPWYGTEYSFRGLSLAQLDQWRRFPKEPALAMAPPNPFLPENIAIKPFEGAPPPAGVPNAAVKPELIVDEGGVRLWFKQDNEFLVPRANFYVYAMTPRFNDSLRNLLLSSFVVSLVNDQLNEYAYPANLAGAFFGLSHRSRGFTLNVGGYDDKQAELLEALLETLVAADFRQERFDIIKTEMIRGWRNAQLQVPYSRLFQETQALLIDPYWPEAERIAAANAITLEDVKAFVPLMLNDIRIEALYHGNVVRADAERMMAIVGRYLKASPDAPLPPFGRVMKLPAGTRIVQEMNIPHDDSAIVIYMQGEDDSLKTRATVTLLGSMLSSPFYDTLRTEQQLGYIVNAGTMPILKTNGLVFYIESPVADPLVLEERIDAFLMEYAQELATMDAARFADIKSGLLNGMRVPPQRLNTLSGRYWSDILVGEYEQDSTLALAAAIEALTQEEVAAWYGRRVADPDAGRLVARSAGRPQLQNYLTARAEDADTVVLDDGNADYEPFKQQNEQFEF